MYVEIHTWLIKRLFIILYLLGLKRDKTFTFTLLPLLGSSTYCLNFPKNVTWLYQWFSAGDCLISSQHSPLAVSGDTLLAVVNSEREHYWHLVVEATDTVTHPTKHRTTSTTKSDLVSAVSSAEVENICVSPLKRGRIIHLIYGHIMLYQCFSNT